MGLEIQQDIEFGHIFCVTLYSGWTWGDIRQAHGLIQEQATDAPTHIFVEIDGPISMPIDIENCAPKWLDRHTQAHGGLLVFVTQWGVVRSLLKLMSAFKPLNFVHFATSIDEAREIVRNWEAVA